MKQQSFWETDELDNAFDYLDKAILFLQNTEKDLWSWKWVAIALQGALYGFMVCMAKGYITEISKTTKKNWSENFDLIFELCQNDRWISQFAGAKKLAVTPQQKKSVDTFRQSLRNGFEQFKPYPTDIKSEGLPEICIDYFVMIKFIIAESETFTPRWEEQQLNRAVCLCDIGIRLAGTSRFSID